MSRLLDKNKSLMEIFANAMLTCKFRKSLDLAHKTHCMVAQTWQTKLGKIYCTLEIKINNVFLLANRFHFKHCSMHH